MKKILYIYEFADRADSPAEAKADMQGGCLQNTVRDLKMQISFVSASGVFKYNYESGLSFKRIFNLLYMHICAPLKILSTGADVIFVRSTPPLIQITYAFWACVFRRKKIFWLMDYHPVFGVRTSKAGTFKRFFWGILDKIDRFFLKKFDLVVCIDEAMQSLVKERAENVETFVCPTFSLKRAQWLDLRKPSGSSAPLKLLYSGNLGRSHSVERLELMLKELSKTMEIEFAYCGGSAAAKTRLKEMCAGLGVGFKAFEFIENYLDLGEFYRKQCFDYGVVLLNDELQGVVSPSKFSGYTDFGLPIIYIGPRGTNAHFVCEKLGAGLCAETEAQILEMCGKIKTPETRNECAKSTSAAVEYFSPKAAARLAKKLEDFCVK